jgi:P27 family predicted phage terminase small subunit
MRGAGRMKGTKPHLVMSNDAVTRAPAPPSWLSLDAKKEWRRILPTLVKRRILTTADLGSLENYCTALGRVREVERLLQGETDKEAFGKLFRIQDKAMATARLYAAELGLTPVSRSRPSIREDEDDDDLNPLDIS